MSTPALVHFHAGNRQSTKFLSVYKHFDGYVNDGLGDTLKDAVAKLKPGFCLRSSWIDIVNQVAIEMAPDGFSLVSDESAEYEYHIFKNDDGSVGLTVDTHEEETDLLPRAPKVFLGFTYETPGKGASWRNIVLFEEDSEYIKGREVDTGEFRCFLKSRIYGGDGGIFRRKEGE